MKKIYLTAAICFSLLANAQWVQQATGFVASQRGVNTITIVDTNVVWVTAVDGTNSFNYITDFSVTSNGGGTWSAGTVNTGITGAGLANISAIDASTAWACVFHPNQTVAGGIWKTTDGGATWNQQSSAAFTASSFPDFVYFWDANNGITVGDPDSSYFEVYTTTDGGTTWTRTANTNNQLSASSLSEYGYTNGFAVAGGTLWFCTTKGRVFKTTDKGLTFTVSTIGNSITDAQRITFSDSDTGYACMHTPGNKSWKIAKTTDGGSTWMPLQNNTSTTNNTILGADICAVSGTGSLISVGIDSSAKGASYSHDGGNTWYFMEDTSLAPPRLSVRFLNASTGWTGAYNADQFTGGIYKFDDVVGISETKERVALEVTPNPTTGLLSVSSQDINGSFSITVYSRDGKSVYTQTYAQHALSLEIDLSFLPQGIYFMAIRTADTVATARLIKQ